MWCKDGRCNIYAGMCAQERTLSHHTHFRLCSHAKRIAGSDFGLGNLRCGFVPKHIQNIWIFYNFFFFVFRIRFSIRCESVASAFRLGFGVQWALINYSSLRKAHWISCVALTSAKIIYPKTLPVLGNRMNLFLFVIDTNARASSKTNTQLGSHSIQFPKEYRTICEDWYNIGALELISIFNSQFRCVRFVARKHVSYCAPPRHTTPSPLHTQQLQLVFITNAELIVSMCL